MGQFDKEAIQTRDYCVAKNATLRADRPDPSLRKSGLLGMTSKLRASRESQAVPFALAHLECQGERIFLQMFEF